MAAGCVKLVFHVEGAEVGLLHEQMLLSQAQAADVQARGVGGGPCDQ